MEQQDLVKMLSDLTSALNAQRAQIDALKERKDELIKRKTRMQDLVDQFSN